MKTAPQSTTQPLTTVVELTTTATKPTPLTTTVLVRFTSDETFDLALLDSTSPQFTNREQKVKHEVCCVETFQIPFYLRCCLVQTKYTEWKELQKNAKVHCTKIWTILLQ